MKGIIHTALYIRYPKSVIFEEELICHFGILRKTAGAGVQGTVDGDENAVITKFTKIGKDCIIYHMKGELEATVKERSRSSPKIS